MDESNAKTGKNIDEIKESAEKLHQQIDDQLSQDIAAVIVATSNAPVIMATSVAAVSAPVQESSILAKKNRGKPETTPTPDKRTAFPVKDESSIDMLDEVQEKLEETDISDGRGAKKIHKGRKKVKKGTSFWDYSGLNYLFGNDKEEKEDEDEDEDEW